MPAEILQQSNLTLTLSDKERDALLSMLRQALGETRVEVHHTHTPDYRELVLDQEALIRSLIAKLERLQPVPPEVSLTIRTGSSGEAVVTDDVYLDDQGRFQMAAEDLGTFVRFLRDNKVYVEAETADAFHSGGKAYRYGRLLHPFDVDSLKSLYHTWRQTRGSRAAEETI
jgi:hypothetical protein